MKIFVSIASYRDPDLQATVESALANATNPENLVFGICEQNAPIDRMFVIPDTRGAVFRVDRVLCTESQGCNWAKNRAQQLCEGEEFTLVLDSHMRFLPGWDFRLLQYYGQVGKKSVITTYCPPFIPGEPLKEFQATFIRFHSWGADGIALLSWTYEPVEEKPRPSMLISGHLTFAPTQFFVDVPYDPSLYIAVEEVIMSARGWVRGWNFYAPPRYLAHHEWTRKFRPQHWDDHRDWFKNSQLSIERAKLLMGVDTGMPTGDCGQFGVKGTSSIARHFDEFQQRAGAWFGTRTILPHGEAGKFPDHDAPNPFPFWRGTSRELAPPAGASAPN